MNTKRLLKLADYLETVPREKFDIKRWGKSETKPRGGCGTAACAVGHACSIPSFRKAGLKLEWRAGDESFDTQWYAVPQYREDESWTAVMGFFNIDYYMAENFFSMYENPNATPKKIARKIRAAVKRHEKIQSKSQATRA